MRFTVNVLPTGGFNEPVEIYVKTKALGMDKDFGLVKTIYPPYQPYLFEKQVPSDIPKGVTINGYVTAKGGGLARDAGTITVNSGKNKYDGIPMPSFFSDTVAC